MGAVAQIITIIFTFFILVGDGTLALSRFFLHMFSSFFSYLTKKRKKKYRSRIRQAKIAYFTIGAACCFLFFTIPFAVIALSRSLPDPHLLASDEAPQTTKIFDRHHVLLYQLYANQNRTTVPLSAIPKSLQQATVAIEDKNFYTNPGFDITGMLRAFLADIRGESLQGGSTITQQLVKTVLLTPRQTLSRKIEEVMLSFWAEHLYTKNQILEMYLNQVAYGGTAWGVEAAAETYFGTSVSDLDLAQSAFLAGMPQAPTTYSPFGTNPTLWKKRQKEVLEKMLELHVISQKEEQKALAEHLSFETPQAPLLAPHFVMYIKDLLVKKYGLALVEKGGLEVTTSLDLSLQDMAQKTVTTEVASDAYLSLTNGAALITNPKNGDILAMVGSHDYNDPTSGAVNVTTSLRQPGSSIKVVTYAAALSHGYTAASVIDDSPISYPDGINTYAPVNYDGRFHGQVTLRTAFANSFNIPAVKTLNAIGIPTFITLGRQMGLSSLEDAKNYGLSLTLGSADVTMLDMATTYGTVANNGTRVDLNPILLVRDRQGDVLEQKTTPDSTQVLSPSVTFILSDILADNNARSLEFGTNSPLVISGKTVSVKTGTTDNKRDNWTIGFNPPTSPTQYVVTVWVGNNDNTPMSQDLASGITGAAPIWHDIMTSLLQKQSNISLKPPSDIVQKPCFGHDEYFVKGTEQNVFCGIAVVPTITVPQPATVGVRIDSQSPENHIQIQ